MRINNVIKLLSLSLVLAITASACGAVDSASNRVSGMFDDSTSERLENRAEDAVARLSDAGSDLKSRAATTVTLSQLQAAGIPIGSHNIGCDDPLDIVVVEGVFDRESLFATGVSMAGGSFEGMAMRMVAEIYDPETDMPLGMIGDQTGSSLSGITHSSDGSIATGSVDGSLMFSSPDNTQAGASLIPEATCQ
jgi:hypothetical protein